MSGVRLLVLSISLLAGIGAFCAPSQGPQSGAEEVWAVVIGASYVRGFTQLRYADDDALLFYDLLCDSLGARVPREQVFLHLSGHDTLDASRQRERRRWKPASRESVLRSVEEVVQNASPGSRIIIFFSGHGGVGRWENEPVGNETLFLVTEDSQHLGVSFQRGDRSWVFRSGTGLKITEIVEKVTESYTRKAPPNAPPLNVWVILDSCHAAAASSAAAQYEQVARERRRLLLGDEIGRGVEAEQQQTPPRGVEAVRPQADPTAGKPSVSFVWVFASDKEQVALEDGVRAHGVFTYYLARAIRGGAWEASPQRFARPENQLTGADLGAYLRRTVNERAIEMPEASGYGQVPVALPDFDNIPKVTFTRTERRFGIAVEVVTPDAASCTVYLRSRDGKRFLVAEPPCLFNLADIDTQLRDDDEYVLEVRYGRRDSIKLNVPLRLSAPTGVRVDFVNHEVEVNTGDKTEKFPLDALKTTGRRGTLSMQPTTSQEEGRR